MQCAQILMRLVAKQLLIVNCAPIGRCRFGLARDATNQCEVCRCYTPPAGCGELPFTCNIINCPGGLQRDSRGCPLCQCNRLAGQVGGVGWAGLGWAGLGWAGLGWAGLGWAGLGWAGLGWAVLRSASTNLCSPSQVCDPVTCPTRCEFGYRRGDQGCLTCMCNPSGQPSNCPTQDVQCTCPSQSIPELDSRGCRTCNCEINTCRGIRFYTVSSQCQTNEEIPNIGLQAPFHTLGYTPIGRQLFFRTVSAEVFIPSDPRPRFF